MLEGYGGQSVCVSVYYHANSYIPGLYVQSEVIYSFLQAFKMWRSVPATMIGDSALSRQKKNTPMILGTITNSLVYELLASSNDYLN